jgi:hypothetical protein
MSPRGVSGVVLGVSSSSVALWGVGAAEDWKMKRRVERKMVMVVRESMVAVLVGVLWEDVCRIRNDDSWLLDKEIVLVQLGFEMRNWEDQRMNSERP